MDDTAQSGQFEEQELNTATPEEGIIEIADPLALSVKDEDLVKVIDKRIEASRHFYETKYNLSARRKKNELYYFGRQISQKEKDGKLKEYESRSQDNVLYEIEASIKPLAMSRLPDLIVTPGDDSQEKKQVALEVSKGIDSDVKTRQNRKVLALAFKHLPVYFTGIVKVRWDPQLAGGMGDYVFENVHPDNIDFDHTCPTNNAEDMSFIAHSLPMTVQDVLMRFPEKKTEFLTELRKDGTNAQSQEEPDWKELATEIRVREVWFTWFEKAEGKDQWERVEGVLWKYKDCILKKMKNPNYDYEGDTQLFTYDDPQLESSKRPLSPEEMMMALATGQMPGPIKQDQIYHNYFDMPKKPFFFMGYDQWGKQPLDETSRIEQNIPNQDTIDKRGKQIDETLDNEGHHVWSKEGGLKPDDIERMDHNNPDEDYLVEGDVNTVHAFIQPARPEPQEFKDLDDKRQRMYAVAGSTATRGEMQTDVATTNQIAREADYTRADDLVEDTINAAAEWMASWTLQMIKLRYTQEHWRWLLGAKGELIYLKLARDMIDEGMEVMIKASGTDKLKAQNNAMEMAKMKMIDPLTFYEDMGLDDPEGRTEKLMMSQMDPMGYIVKYVQGLQNPADMGQALMGQPVPGQPGQPPMPPQMMGGQPPMPGMPPGQPPMGAPGANPMMPQGPTPGNTAAAPIAPPPGAPQGSPRGL